MTLTPTLTAPVAALLDRVAAVLREGVDGFIRPEDYAPGYWDDWQATPERTGAPAGHFLLTEGTKMYLDSERVTVDAPYCVISLPAEPTARGNRVPSAFWRVPVRVELCWEGDDTDPHIRKRLAMLMALLCTDAPEVPTVSQRLSRTDSLEVEENVFVFEREAITDIRPEPLRLESGHPVARLNFTVLCCGLPPRSLEITIADQSTDATLPRADYTALYRDFIFTQETEAVEITLEGPLSGEKAITVTHTGTAAFTLQPGPHTIQPDDILDFHWNEITERWDTGI